MNDRVLSPSRQNLYEHLFSTPIHAQKRPLNMAGTLPPLSSEDKEIYGRAATTMGWYHQRLKDSWKALYEACSSGKRPANTSIRQFLNIGSNFCHHLGLHHSIGMAFSIPIVNRRVTSFGRGAKHISHPCAENASFREGIGTADPAQRDTQGYGHA